MEGGSIIKISIKKLELVLNYPIKRNICCTGFDIASRSGFCYAQTKQKYCNLNWNYIEFSKKKKDKYSEMVESFENIITGKENVNVIEDTYLRYFGKYPQVNVFKQLTRYGSFAISESIKKDVPYEIIGAKAARSRFKIKVKGRKKSEIKKCVSDWLKEKLKIDLKGDDDISDAIVLSLLGLCKGLQFEGKKK